MRGVLHAEVLGFNFSADINPYQRSDDYVITAGQTMETPHDVKAVSYTQPALRKGEGGQLSTNNKDSASFPFPF